jgi:hypothetical protein
MYHYHHDQTKPIVILLSGWAGSGKDAAAALLVEELDFQRLAFADALKREVSAMSGIPLEIFHDSRKNRHLANHVVGFPTAQTPRDILIQRSATIRTTNPDHYAELVGHRICNEGGMRYVISDWRYPNEYEALSHILEGRKFTFLRVRIERSNIVSIPDPSEHQLDGANFDAVIQNDGSISDLRDAIKAVVRPILHKH